MIGIVHYMILSSIIFTIGIFGIIVNRRHMINTIIAIELMLLAANINLISVSIALNDLAGQIFAIFILTVAAAEAAIGLAILVVYNRNKGDIEIKNANLLRN